MYEERLGGKSFGSTKSGIAPFYSDKYAKIGFQISELFEDEAELREGFLFLPRGLRQDTEKRYIHTVLPFLCIPSVRYSM